MKIRLLTGSYHRKILDRDMGLAMASLKAMPGVNGRVIDLGGENRRRRGNFQPDFFPDTRWICLNIDPSESPEIVADVHQVPLAEGCAQAVVCSEVLEHVAHPQRVMEEAYRLLMPGGRFIGSMPFMFRVHADPHDYQRFTRTRLGQMMASAGFVDIEIRPQGYYFTVLADMIRDGLNQLKIRWLRWALAGLLYPWMKLFLFLDTRRRVADSPFFTSYTTGYFFTGRKGTG